MAILFISALLLVNSYHLYLVVKIRPQMGNVNSVSESALYNNKILVAFRVIHSLCAIVFISSALYIVYLDIAYFIPSLLLIFAGIFDITQGYVLTKKTSHAAGDFFDPHQLRAWLMSIFYVSACTVFLFMIGLWYQLAVPMIGLLVVTAIWLKFTKNKYFYIGQMIFFFAVSIGLGFIALTLLPKFF